MLIMRFYPMGRKHNKVYRVVVADKRRHVSKLFQENLGWYNPHTKQCILNKERVAYYLGLNIEISDSVKSLLQKQELISI